MLQSRQAIVIPSNGKPQMKRRMSMYHAPVSERVTILDVAQVKPPRTRKTEEIEHPVILNKKENDIMVQKEDVKPKIVKLSIEDLRNIKQGKPIEKTKPLIIQDTPAKKSPVKLINGNLGKVNKKPVLLNSMMPTKKTEEHVVQVAEGRLEIISMETGENDPLKLAEPVETNVFPCTECDRSFPLRQLLEIHKTNHVRERNHPCELCDKRFFSKYDLAKHNMTHTGERPYVCVICKSAFPRATLLTRHQKVLFSINRMCVFISRIFSCNNICLFADS